MLEVELDHSLSGTQQSGAILLDKATLITSYNLSWDPSFIIPERHKLNLFSLWKIMPPPIELKFPKQLRRNSA